MTVGIIGCGTMGAGIAQVAATFKNKVIVVDTNEDALNKANSNLQETLQKLQQKGKLSEEKRKEIIDNIQWTSDFHTLQDAELIIEAIIENIDIKQKVFAQIESIVSEKCVLATNTSSLSITSIAAACAKPHRVIGIHFFNPAAIMQLVEIIPALQTDSTIVAHAKSVIESWNKVTVIAKDTPGFIVNRIARPFYSEAIRIYEEGIASIEMIDFSLKKYGGFKMGPFELMDLIGHDVNYTVTETVWKSFYFDTKYTPSFSQKRLVEAKWFGKKSGRGFYQYTSQNEQVKQENNYDETACRIIVNRVLAMLIHEAANALYLNIATKQDIELAMTKGVNYPKGLLEWANEIGIENVRKTLDDLYEYYHEERYRYSPLLKTIKQF
ncbi:MAG: 3-hydroxybutyryl-CoA dehydrogenase [Chitinophagaceae bacterium]|nr:MAG: 3-hydroxybutyryl-CoA dehydrogenase [Bacteroidetes bacterium OLB11]MCC6447085.1 3-hydroxybutyryl-CoA dehydrogenase [Chitinophagaceae bacterium]HMN33598.1 3-hydroxyacyl-CoA dehydrogenase NAD-binding domain-containing protein [Chitinophagaceae bacterium]